MLLLEIKEKVIIFRIKNNSAESAVFQGNDQHKSNEVYKIKVHKDSLGVEKGFL